MTMDSGFPEAEFKVNHFHIGNTPNPFPMTYSFPHSPHISLLQGAINIHMNWKAILQSAAQGGTWLSSSFCAVCSNCSTNARDQN